MKKKRFTFERIKYWFDCMMSKGAVVTTLLLFGFIFVTVAIMGVLAFLVSDDGGFGYQLWMSLMHTIDPGTLAGNVTDNVPYLVLMFLATMFGLFVMSMLIGIIATGVENKFRELQKGKSIVQEENHTVIIGFDNNVFILLKELIEANSNHKNQCVVVLGEQSKEEMEEMIASHIPDTKTTRIICRSGNLHEAYSLAKCAVERSRSVIVNIHEDAKTIKTILALSSYIKDKELFSEDLCFVMALQDKQYIEAAEIAGEGRSEIIYTKDAIARIIANTCRQHGLSQVLTELFNFGGNELYFEQIPSMVGRTFKETLNCFVNAVVVGLYSDGQVYLNPPMDTVIKEMDQLVLLEEDDGSYKIIEGICDANAICCEQTNIVPEISNLVILGSNDKLPIILSEYSKYVTGTTKIILVDDDISGEKIQSYENLDITICEEKVTKELLNQFIEEGVTNILLLNDDSEEPEVSDSHTLLRLILLRDIADKSKKHLSITTEMQNVDNQRLAAQARVDDFVIGTNFASLLMAQISENRKITPLITDLLDETGSELYMKPVKNYVKIGEAISGYTLTESAAQKGEIFVGYRHASEPPSFVVVNPDKNKEIIFEEEDLIVVISEN